MSRKTRQLIAELEKAGFVNRGGKGNHWNFMHPDGLRVTLSSKKGADAAHYQEKNIRLAILKTRK